MVIIAQFANSHVEFHDVDVAFVAGASDANVAVTLDKLGRLLGFACGLRRSTTSAGAQELGGVDMGINGSSSNAVFGTEIATCALNVHKGATGAGGLYSLYLLIIISDAK